MKTLDDRASELLTQPSQAVYKICATHYPFECVNCPIVSPCFESHGKPDHYEVVNLAAEALMAKKN